MSGGDRGQQSYISTQSTPRTHSLLVRAYLGQMWLTLVRKLMFLVSAEVSLTGGNQRDLV